MYGKMAMGHDGMIPFSGKLSSNVANRKRAGAIHALARAFGRSVPAFLQ
jgi:hypothetical protein